MNRIYQGKVNNVEVRNPDKEAITQPWLFYHRDPKRATKLTERIPELRGKLELELTKRAKMSKQEREREAKSPELKEYEQLRDEQRQQWQSVLWQHHELFQEAVNYYLSVFTAMIDERRSPSGLREFREAVVRSWSDAAHSNGSWQMPVLGLTVSGARAWKVFEKRIFTMTGSKASATQRAAAVDAIFDAATKVAAGMDEPGATLEDRLRGKGRSLFPKLKLLCARSTGTTPDDVRFAQEKLAHRATKRVEQKGKLTWNDVFAFKTNDERRPWTAQSPKFRRA